MSRIRFSAQTPWYELFSRGARDWLRHNQKVRDAVKDQLADLLAGGDFITQPDQRTLHVPVRLLEHARFRLADAPQGKTVPAEAPHAPATRCVRGRGGGCGDAEGEGGQDDGGLKLLLELKVDDIVDWLTEELELPDLKPKSGATIEDDEIVREGSGGAASARDSIAVAR